MFTPTLSWSGAIVPCFTAIAFQKLNSPARAFSIPTSSSRLLLFFPPKARRISSSHSSKYGLNSWKRFQEALPSPMAVQICSGSLPAIAGSQKRESAKSRILGVGVNCVMSWPFTFFVTRQFIISSSGASPWGASAILEASCFQPSGDQLNPAEHRLPARNFSLYKDPGRSPRYKASWRAVFL